MVDLRICILVYMHHLYVLFKLLILTKISSIFIVTDVFNSFCYLIQILKLKKF